MVYITFSFLFVIVCPLIRGCEIKRVRVCACVCKTEKERGVILPRGKYLKGKKGNTGITT